MSEVLGIFATRSRLTLARQIIVIRLVVDPRRLLQRHSAEQPGSVSQYIHHEGLHLVWGATVQLHWVEPAVK
jgi:hypothetical protein